MLPSKENCQIALDRISQLIELDLNTEEQSTLLLGVQEFLLVALRRLPSEAALIKDRARSHRVKTVAITNLPDPV